MGKVPPLSNEMKHYFVTIGKLGSANMTPEQRRARALKANAASHKAKAAKKAKLAAEVAQLRAKSK